MGVERRVNGYRYHARPPHRRYRILGPQRAKHRAGACLQVDVSHFLCQTSRLLHLLRVLEDGRGSGRKEAMQAASDFAGLRCWVLAVVVADSCRRRLKT